MWNPDVATLPPDGGKPLLFGSENKDACWRYYLMVVSVAVLSFIDRDALIAVFILPHSNFWFFFFINVTHRYWFLLNSVECSSVLNYIPLTSITSNLENTGSLISSSTFKMSAVCIIVVVTLRNEKNPWPLTGTLYVFVCLFFNKSTPIWWQKARCGQNPTLVLLKSLNRWLNIYLLLHPEQLPAHFTH